MNKKKKMTHTELLQKLVSTGMKMRYGDNLKSVSIRTSVTRCSMVPVKMLWEMKQIIDAGFVDYYLMAFWIFHHYAKSADIGFWARGAMPSSIVCHCLGLTEVDPMKYGLHSERFVNDEPPKFQFDIESSRFGEFMNRAEEVLAANEKDFDIASVRSCLFQDVNPSPYLNKKMERQIPNDLDDEIARYALSFPETMNLFDSYVRRKEGKEEWKPTGIVQLDKIMASTFGLLAYQEQMLDILKDCFRCSAVERNHIRRSIQRGETEQMEAYKAELFANLKDLTSDDAERVWSVLVSNPRAFLKAHAVSRVIEKYMFYDINDK